MPGIFSEFINYSQKGEKNSIEDLDKYWIIQHIDDWLFDFDLLN